AYLEWARFPLVEAEVLGEPTPGYLVHFSDVRFMYPDGHPERHSGADPATRRGRLVAYVLLDSDLRKIGEGFGSPTGPQWRAAGTRPGNALLPAAGAGRV